MFIAMGVPQRSTWTIRNKVSVLVNLKRLMTCMIYNHSKHFKSVFAYNDKNKQSMHERKLYVINPLVNMHK